MLIIAPHFLSIDPWRYHRRGIPCLDAIQEMGGIKGFTCHDSPHVMQANDEILGFGDVMPLPPVRRKRARLPSPSTTA